ncbi:MAG: STAS domain-containing protein [Nevskiales bacterium]
MSLVIEYAGPDLRLTGELDHAGVSRALIEARPWLTSGQGPLRVDLGGVKRSESAGVALLLEWLRQAHRLDREIEFLNPPAQMRSLLKFFDLECVLTIRV